MKIYLQLILLSITFLTFSCKENKVDQKAEKQVEVKKSKEPHKNLVEKKKNIEKSKHYEHKYVIARSGLNYRDLPNGKVLGKFPLNTQLKIIESTKIYDQIKDGGKLIKGEWVGVQNWVSNKKSDTVYVFNGFLSSYNVQSDIKIYFASSYYEENNERTRTAFLNLSETYFQNTYNENEDRTNNLILNETDLTKDTIRLNKNQRKKLINKLKLSESDKVFIYLIKSDTVLNFKIKDLQAIACMNIYGPSSDYGNDEYDYMLGFDLGNKIKDNDNLAYIGKENPFQTGKIKPMIWEKTNNSNFPIDEETIINNNTILETYSLTLSNFKYFVKSYKQKKKNYNYIKTHHFVIIDTIKKSILSNRIYNSSESIDLSPVYTSNMETGYYSSYHWTGELFKNKPPIIYGLLSHSFGCPSIDFIVHSEPSISILCDNRH